MKYCPRCVKKRRLSSFHKGQGYCKSCKREYLQRWLKGLSEKKKKWYRRTEDKKGQLKRRKKRAWALRLEMIAAYGGSCSCCGEKEPVFLTLEHLGGGGNRHRRKFNRASRTWLDLKRKGWPKKEYTILCWNCQMAKTHFRNCPHVL